MNRRLSRLHPPAWLLPAWVLFVPCLCQSTWAQPPADTASSPATLVALVDIQQVFDSHLAFKTGMKKLQEELQAADRTLQSKKEQLDARSKQLSNLNPSSADYGRLESQLAQQSADLQVQARQIKKQFLQREAMQYYNAYNEIVSAVRQVAELHGIQLVLRFDSGTIDPNQPQAVAQGMSRTVVVQRNLDITQHVVNALQVMLASHVEPQENTPRR